MDNETKHLLKTEMAKAHKQIEETNIIKHILQKPTGKRTEEELDELV